MFYIIYSMRFYLSCFVNNPCEAKKKKKAKTLSVMIIRVILLEFQNTVI